MYSLVLKKKRIYYCKVKTFYLSSNLLIAYLPFIQFVKRSQGNLISLRCKLSSTFDFIKSVIFSLNRFQLELTRDYFKPTSYVMLSLYYIMLQVYTSKPLNLVQPLLIAHSCFIYFIYFVLLRESGFFFLKSYFRLKAAVPVVKKCLNLKRFLIKVEFFGSTYRSTFSSKASKAFCKLLGSILIDYFKGVRFLTFPKLLSCNALILKLFTFYNFSSFNPVVTLPKKALVSFFYVRKKDFASLFFLLNYKLLSKFNVRLKTYAFYFLFFNFVCLSASSYGLFYTKNPVLSLTSIQSLGKFKADFVLRPLSSFAFSRSLRHLMSNITFSFFNDLCFFTMRKDLIFNSFFYRFFKNRSFSFLKDSFFKSGYYLNHAKKTRKKTLGYFYKLNVILFLFRIFCLKSWSLLNTRFYYSSKSFCATQRLRAASIGFSRVYLILIYLKLYLYQFIFIPQYIIDCQFFVPGGIFFSLGESFPSTVSFDTLYIKRFRRLSALAQKQGFYFYSL